ncbi:MAG: DUF2520 domain-containing protein [Armatimonadetes bacterium]|nr:DUF2520 domain-containing protein [Armatimonadota bacterium]
MKHFRIGIIGPGRVGLSLGSALKACGYPLYGVMGRMEASSSEAATRLGCAIAHSYREILERSDLVLLCVPDKNLPQIACSLASSGAVKEEQIFLHVSGSLSSEVLRPLKDAGGRVGSLHPLRAFAAPLSAPDMAGTYFSFEGDTNIRPAVEKLTSDLKGFLFDLPADGKALYHAGACMASNYLVTLFAVARDIFQRLGIPADEASKAILSLVRGTVANLALGAPEKALTGPVARGDEETISAHLDALRSRAPEYLQTYLTLGKATLDLLASANGDMGAVAALLTQSEDQRRTYLEARKNHS